MKMKLGLLSLCVLPLTFSSFAFADSERSDEKLQKLRAWACERGVSDKDLEHALKSSKKDRLVFADYGLSAKSKRLFVYDLSTGEVSKYRVTHGLGNGPHSSEFQSFKSNEASRAVPGGVHVLSEDVHRGGKRLLAETLRLNGVENDNRSSAARGITFGNCGVLSRRMSESAQVYRSWGSMCLPEKDAKELLPKVKGSALVNFDSRKAAKNRVCPQVEVQPEIHQGDERTDESFERTEHLPMDSDRSQVEIHSETQEGIE